MYLNVLNWLKINIIKKMYKVPLDLLETNREMLSDFYELLLEKGKIISAEKVRKQIKLLDKNYLKISI